MVEGGFCPEPLGILPSPLGSWDLLGCCWGRWWLPSILWQGPGQRVCPCLTAARRGFLRDEASLPPVAEQLRVGRGRGTAMRDAFCNCVCVFAGCDLHLLFLGGVKNPRTETGLTMASGLSFSGRFDTVRNGPENKRLGRTA